MTEGPAFLVVGGDSLVGGGLVDALNRRSHRVFASTRRRETLGAQRVHLDFEDRETFRAPPGVGYAYLIAAATNYARCEQDPLAKIINVKLIPDLAASLRGRFPQLAVVLMSGYPDDGAIAAAGLEGEDVLRKPFSLAHLVTKIREALAGRRS